MDGCYQQDRDLIMHVICFPICSCVLPQNGVMMITKDLIRGWLVYLFDFYIIAVQIFPWNYSSLLQNNLSNWPILAFHPHLCVSLICSQLHCWKNCNDYEEFILIVLRCSPALLHACAKVERKNFLRRVLNLI